jgi:hypothetical protein
MMGVYEIRLAIDLRQSFVILPITLSEELLIDADDFLSPKYGGVAGAVHLPLTRVHLNSVSSFILEPNSKVVISKELDVHTW